MFGRFVEIEGHKIFVTCSPHTPLSEVLHRAADIQAGLERIARANDPIHLAYQKAVDDLWRHK